MKPTAPRNLIASRRHQHQTPAIGKKRQFASSPTFTASAASAASATTSTPECEYVFIDEEDDYATEKRKKTAKYQFTKCEYTSIFVWINLIGLILLSIGFVLLLVFCCGSTHSVVESVRDTSPPPTQRLLLQEMSFNLVPNNTDRRRGQSLVLSTRQYHIDYETLLFYTVCCHTQTQFFCSGSSTTESVGISALLLSEEQSLTVSVLHPDVIGARCRLVWRNRK